jgi:hypothetical protein
LFYEDTFQELLDKIELVSSEKKARFHPAFSKSFDRGVKMLVTFLKMQEIALELFGCEFCETYERTCEKLEKFCGDVEL